MPELLLELFSEEIPARMQARGAEDLVRLVSDALAPLSPRETRGFFGPRRIALSGIVAAGVAESRTSERGPRVTAPEQALAGFLRKHGADRGQLRQDGEFWVLDKLVAGIDAAALIARVVPDVLRRFPWPKSMRWGGTSGFTWVRPLRRILCLLDGVVVPFDLREGDDDGHGLASGDITEGHRFLAPAPFAVYSAADWQAGLRERRVLVDAAERRAVIADGLRALAAERGLTLVEDDGLLDEVAGLVEWPVPLLGRIDAAYMDLPPEVMQVSMRVNQRYFALRDAEGKAAPWFAFAANIEAADGGATIVAGNERVLRARFADARHFWDLDHRQTLSSRIPDLDKVTFHARLGTQGERVDRLKRLAGFIAPTVGASVGLAQLAAALSKADLTTGMVGEFPELQGVMGRYYALHDAVQNTAITQAVADAIRDHYAPRGPSDSPPTDPVSIAVALADKIDLLAGFFSIGEKPSGSGDPYALRRAALGIIRIARWRRLNLLNLRPLFQYAATLFVPSPSVDELVDFVIERLRVQLRTEGSRHDILSAVLALGTDDNIARLLDRFDAVAALLDSEDGRNLLAAYRRAANILRIEEKKDGPHDGDLNQSALELAEEIQLQFALDSVILRVMEMLRAEAFWQAMTTLASLRPYLDAFFEHVTVNDPRPDIRRNRLRLLARVRAAMHLAADFSRIEG